MKFFIKTFILLVSANVLLAQQTPADPQTEAIAIIGATAHLGNGTVIENSFIAFENGKLTNVADATSTQIDRSKFGKIIEANGKHVYPGFILPATNLGLREISAVRASNDDRELGYLNPHIRSIIAYNTDSEVTPTIRSNGILLAQATPRGGRISGQSSVVELDAWNWEDAAYKMDEGIHVNYPSFTSWNWRTRTVSKNKDYDKQVKELEDYLKEAAAYVKNSNLTSKNLKFEAMRGLFDGSKKLYVHVDYVKSISETVLMTKKLGITPVIVGGEQSYLLTELLKKNNVPVILAQVHSRPSTDDADIDQPFKTPKMLADGGVLFCLKMDDGPEQSRNLPFQAGHAAGFGLDKEAALSSITLNAAKILGVDKTVGSLEKGKDATLFISTGDALDIRGNNVENAFISGKEIDLGNKQKALYEKFMKKYSKK